MCIKLTGNSKFYGFEQQMKNKIFGAGKAFLFICCRLLLVFKQVLSGNKSVKTYLILKKDGLGDLIIWISYSKKLKEYIHNNKGKMILATADFNVSLARRLGLADTVVALPVYKGPLQYLISQLIFYIRCGTWQYEIIAQASLTSASVAGYLIDPLKSDLKISLQGTCNINPPLEKFFNHVINVDDETIHGRYRRFYQELTGETVEMLSPVCADDFCQDLQSCHDNDFITICIGGSISNKRWPLDYWVGLLKKICRIYKGEVLIIGDKTQFHEAEIIISSLSEYDCIQNCCGRFSILQLYPLFRAARFTISMDTGPAHLAASVSGKVFVICGNGERGIFFPWPQEYGEGKNVFSIYPPLEDCAGCRWLDKECLKLKTFRCISAVTPETVFNVVKKSFHGSIDVC